MKKSKNNKFGFKTIINDDGAVICIKALETVSITEIVDVIFSEAMDLKFKSLLADSSKKIRISFVSSNGEVREFKRTRIWINEQTLLYEIASQIKI